MLKSSCSDVTLHLSLLTICPKPPHQATINMLHTPLKHVYSEGFSGFTPSLTS